jgi:AcrR family transcriptional regulator
MTAPQPDRRTRAGSDRAVGILRAAEKTFAQKGYHATTMREVATEAGVGLSLVVYHFTNKHSLYYAIFENRQYVNDECRERLLAITELTSPRALDAIVDALIGPVLALYESEDDIWYARLALREAGDPSSQERPVISAFFDPVARAFTGVIEKALPDKQPGFYQWAYLLSVGALTQSTFDSRVENLTPTPQFARKNDVLRSYITAALRYG